MNSLEVSGLIKRFGSRKVFSDISFQLQTGQSLAITGLHHIPTTSFNRVSPNCITKN